jgi:hypothetical protein
MTLDGTEQTLRELLQRWLDATVCADADALEGMLEKGYTFTHATTAITDTREEWLESFRSGRRHYKSWTVSDVTVRLFESAAVMTGRGHQEVVREDGIFNLDTSFTNVWVDQDGQWKLAVWQATLVPER